MALTNPTAQKTVTGEIVREEYGIDYRDRNGNWVTSECSNYDHAVVKRIYDGQFLQHHPNDFRLTRITTIREVLEKGSSGIPALNPAG